MSQVMRGVAGVVGAAVIWLAAPSESQAIFHWFRCNPSVCSSQATTYAPPFVPQVTTVGYAPAFGGCAPCASSCVPQTAYRPLLFPRPVVTYMPVQTCGPCGATVAYQPTTTWVRQVRMVPYSSYRVAYSNPCAPCVTPCYSACSTPCYSACPSPCGVGGCATGGCGLTTYAAPSGCNTCATTTTVTTPQPTLAPAPSYGAPAPTPAQSPAPASAPAPAASPAPATTPTPTFRNSESGPADLRLKPIPSSTSSPENTLPRVSAPGNHTAQRPVYHAAYYFTSSTPAAAPIVKSKVIDDIDGWQVGRE